MIPPTKLIGFLNKEDIGKDYTLHGIVSGLRETKGPKVAILNDGTGRMQLKFFPSALKNKEELEEGAGIRVTATIQEYRGTLEGNVRDFQLLSGPEKENLLSRISKRRESKSRAREVAFLVESDTLTSLKERFVDAAKLIRSAVIARTPILLRHHADCDGFSAAVALEKAILPLITEHHKDEQAAYKQYRRAPSRAPYYDYEDATKDVVFFVEDQERFKSKRPLVIVADNGSTSDDLLALEKLKAFGCKIIVVDHHYPGELSEGVCEADRFIDVHINPHLVGGDSSISAGMLSSELSRFVNDGVADAEITAAVSAIADRCRGKEAEEIISLASKKVDRAYLEMLADVVDFEAYSLKYLEARSYMAMLFDSENEEVVKLVRRLHQIIEGKKREVLLAVRKYQKVTDLGSWLFLELNTYGIHERGDFPPPGKILGIARDLLEAETKRPVAAVAVSDSMVSMRFSDALSLDVNRIISLLKEKIPHAGIQGGGHARAGSFRFYSIARDEVAESVRKIILNYEKEAK